MTGLIFIIIISAIIVTTLVAFSNLLSAPRLHAKHLENYTTRVSVCIPARNEENNIANILYDLSAQTYPGLEILVLDDCSEDNTYKTAKFYSKKHKNISVISGKPLPPGWTGKNWACHQLSIKAKGSIIFFIDSDVILAPWVIESAIACMNHYKLSMLTAFPAQKMVTFSERLIVPLMDWILLTFLPLKMVYLCSWISFVAANGQFIAFRKDAYDKIGGHNAVAKMIVEDMELARNIKKQKFKMMTFAGYKGAACRMYSGFTDAFKGFTKNFYPGFNTGIIQFCFMLLFLNFLYTLPFILLFFSKNFIAIVVLIIIQRILISLTNRQNFLINSVLHPLHMIIMTLVGINSVHKSSKGKLKWKGRQL